MATTIAGVSRGLASRCEFCKERIDRSNDFARGVNDDLQAPGCELRHVGQETIGGGDGGSVALLLKRPNFFGTALDRSNWTDHSYQGRRLVGQRHGLGAVDCELALVDHVHQFDAGEHGARGPERFEVEHQLGQPLDGAMILLDNVVEVFNLAHKYLHVAAGVDRIDGRLVGPAFVHRDLVRVAVRSHGLVEEALRRGHVALGRQQEVDSLALLVDSAVEVFPDALELDVGLIHAQAAANRALVFVGHLLDERQETNGPPVDR